MVRDPTLSDEMRRALENATAALDRYNVSYALIGGMATSYRSQPRFTKDIDFLVKVPLLVLPPLLEDLLGRGFEFDTLATIGEWIQHHNQVDIENLVAANRDSLDLEWIKAEWQTIGDLGDPRMRWLWELLGEFGQPG